MEKLTEKEEKELTAAAAKVREKAHAPYSEFQVGAALLCKSGKVFTGCNVENASYGLCICAERGAVMAAVAAGERQFKGIVVITDAQPAASPCGACRQFLVEFNPEMQVVSTNLQGERRSWSAAELLPGYFSFGENDDTEPDDETDPGDKRWGV
ncbi:MAG: cytidine deaminase [Candidatus Sumerlaeaceae bacterium]|nr:cytidine deaminase [Candidatus Sumerlaeaceae bacterium]